MKEIHTQTKEFNASEELLLDECASYDEWKEQFFPFLIPPAQLDNTINELVESSLKGQKEASGDGELLDKVCDRFGIHLK